MLLTQVMECVNVQTCANIVGFQLTHNNVVHNMRKELHPSKDWT